MLLELDPDDRASVLRGAIPAYLDGLEPGERARLVAEAAQAAADEPVPAWTLDDGLEIDGDGDLPTRRWLFRDWIPAARLSSLYGRAEGGKSRICLHLAHAVGCGGPALPWDPWLDGGSGKGGQLGEDRIRGDVPAAVEDERGPVLMVTWEDEVNELRRRWRMMHRAGAIEVEIMPREIRILDMRRIGGALWGPGGTGHTSTHGDWTEAGRRLIATLADHVLCMIDPLAAAYACSENDRALVRQFCAALDRAAEEKNCAVLLAAHPSKAGESGSVESGSTDWRGAVRSRLVLQPQQTGFQVETDEVDDKGNRTKKRIKAPCLQHDKASYSENRNQVWLRSHFVKGDTAWPELAWFATTEEGAAEALDDRPLQRIGKSGGGPKGGADGQSKAASGGRHAVVPVTVA